MDWVLHFDGGVTVNPGGVMTYGFHLDTADGDRLAEGGGKVPGFAPDTRTNNTAELYALLMGLRAALAVQAEPPATLRVFGDSRLAVNAATGRYRMQKPHLRELAELVWEELAAVRRAGVAVEVEWVPRAENARADALGRV